MVKRLLVLLLIAALLLVIVLISPKGLAIVASGLTLLVAVWVYKHCRAAAENRRF